MYDRFAVVMGFIAAVMFAGFALTEAEAWKMRFLLGAVVSLVLTAFLFIYGLATETWRDLSNDA